LRIWGSGCTWISARNRCSVVLIALRVLFGATYGRRERGRGCAAVLERFREIVPKSKSDNDYITVKHISKYFHKEKKETT